MEPPKLRPEFGMMWGTKKSRWFQPGTKREGFFGRRGLIAPSERLGRFIVLDKKSPLFHGVCELLNEEAAAMGGKVIHLVLGNFAFIPSKAVAAGQARWGPRVVLHFLPPYCPDHNRIERLWKDLHDNVTRNHTCATMNELLPRVNSYLELRRHGSHEYLKAA